MLSIELVRNNPDAVREALERRGEHAPLDTIVSLDAERRSLLTELEGLRAERNRVSREMGRMSERPAEMVEEMRRTGDRIRGLEERVKETEAGLETELMALPNLPLPGVPDGADETANTVVSTWGTPRTYEFTPLPHWDLGEHLGIIDLSRGAKLSGSRFFTLSGAGARLQRALTAWMIDLHVQEHGYREVYVPYLVRRDTMYGSGNLPKFADNLYHDEEDDLWLIPTAEVPLTGFHRDEILEPGTLPLYYVSHTPSFRREKAAAGKDTRGIKRVHQFDKVELYKLVEPDSSGQELEKLLEDAKDVCRRLDIPYRVVRLCAGDMGFPSAESYDLEMWAPGCEEWLEVSSCSNCTDFQARRANIRFRPQAGARPQLVHTLNGSGLALPRVLIAIMETYQQSDGSISVPDVLRPYMGLDTITP
ncbi:MAG: serine--tRNA ligase [Chloroflexota bacterium]|nr:serine--tRNA ligase [Chloroflexota bacterium]MDE2941542.1 serine--tRNA ligase [Chloroflexota bacterium]MDE3267524.1 serine--tRNA ligase [Chloroflexota bacterium]